MRYGLRILLLMVSGVLAGLFLAACGDSGGDSVTSVMSNADLSGDYSAVILGFVNAGTSNDVWDGVFALRADGRGNMIINSTVLSGGGSISNTATYDVAYDGQFTMGGLTGGKGIVSKDGGAVAWADIETTDGIGTGLGIRNSTGMTTIGLKGHYLCGQFGHNFDTGDPLSRIIYYTFNGDTTGEYIFSSGPFPAKVLFTYNVKPDGTIVFLESNARAYLKGDRQLISLSDTSNAPDSTLSKTVCIRKSAGMDNSKLRGDYIVTMMGFSDTAGPRTRIMNFKAEGTGKGSFTTMGDSSGATDFADFTYTVNADGTASIGTLGLLGIVEANGNMFLAMDTDSADGTVEMAFGIRK